MQRAVGFPRLALSDPFPSHRQLCKRK
uniref:Uncharacterized protein n=1 Tax=Anguilla anguilla TaxID=7936 RepID=A0A0E9Q8V1_ANGAN